MKKRYNTGQTGNTPIYHHREREPFGKTKYTDLHRDSGPFAHTTYQEQQQRNERAELLLL